ncbi:site-specific integrase [Staphylococcus felis]|uniref:site-specific integrase n=1 Tax=Staphylococcus felis TaxID=46127 RepID=UPI000E231651|nr:tyrosine-type recombinase/integrase [Staphylococcus felis]REH95120.1 site-specific integrase [Staphylococcus felis]
MATFQKRGQKWQARVNSYDEKTGKRKRITKTFKTKNEAKRWANLVEYDTESYKLLNDEITLNIWLTKYLEVYRKGKVSDRTIQNDEYTKKRIINFFGDIKLSKVTPVLYQEFWDWLKEKNYSKSTAKQSHQMLVNAFELAIKQGLIKRNPALDYKMPKFKKKKKINWLEADEVKNFYSLIKKRNIYQYFVCVTAIELGCRVGEVLAIKMNDIDFENQTIRIDESYDQKSNTWTTTKNGEIRILDFSNSYKNILNQMLKLHETNKVLHEDLYNNRFDTLHVNEIGEPVPLSSLYNSLQYIGKKHFNKDLSMHKLRHTHASLLLQAGADMTYIQHRLGHSSSVVTAEVYVHMTETMKKEQFKKYQSFFDKIYNEGSNKGASNIN